MKNYILAAAMAFFATCFVACGNRGDNGADKSDSSVTPGGQPNTVETDSTKPANAPGMDTVGEGKSSSSGIPDTSHKK